MATGPEHYREAERLRALVPEPDGNVTFGTAAATMLAAAQVHAILALAAATALNDADGGTSPEDYRAWRRVASVELAAERRARNVESTTPADAEAEQSADPEKHEDAEGAPVRLPDVVQGMRAFEAYRASNAESEA